RTGCNCKPWLKKFVAEENEIRIALSSCPGPVTCAQSSLSGCEKKEGLFLFFSILYTGEPSYDIKGADLRRRRRACTTLKSHLRQERRTGGEPSIQLRQDGRSDDRI